VVTPWIAEVANLGYNGDVHKHLRRLGRIWIDAPIYFVTTCTKDRRQLLARDEVANILIDEWRTARDRHGWAVGRYVVMPDHVHFGNWKSWTSRKIHALNLPRSTPAATTLWQREFFDHVLRSAESYREKWNYVRDNPVRAGLVSTAMNGSMLVRSRR
jgi:putative transposase